MSLRKHFVVFYSPGSFTSESSEKPIAEWDPKKAVKMAAKITERHGARPFGFYFETRLGHEDIDDGEGGKLKVQSKTVAKSGMHYIGGVVRTRAQVEMDNFPSESILRDNMRINDIAKIVVTINGYRSTNEFRKGDVCVDAKGEITERG